MCISSRPSTYIMWSNVNLGSLGSKGHFHLKCYNSSNLHSMTIRLIHVHQLLTLYLSYGVKYQSRVIWGHGDQKVIFTKNVSTPFNYVALTHYLYICYNLTPSTKFMGIQNHPGSFGVTGVKRSFSLKML